MIFNIIIFYIIYICEKIKHSYIMPKKHKTQKRQITEGQIHT